MLKSYDVTSRATFINRDFGAAIPESALLEIIESKYATETSNVHKNMAGWIDKQISKLILGQTMTTTDEESSCSQSETHDKVREPYVCLLEV
jgi:phage gp29-like protein